MNFNHNSHIKSAFHSKNADSLEYLQDIQRLLAHRAISNNIDKIFIEQECIQWQCALCRTPIQLHILADNVNFVCDDCKEIELNQSIQLAILKSSNNLRLHLSSQIYKNYDVGTATEIINKLIAMQ
jgi:hypothetical protein